jgi:hypothetical protein
MPSTLLFEFGYYLLLLLMKKYFQKLMMMTMMRKLMRFGLGKEMPTTKIQWNLFDLTLLSKVLSPGRYLLPWSVY